MASFDKAKLSISDNVDINLINGNISIDKNISIAEDIEINGPSLLKHRFHVRKLDVKNSLKKDGYVDKESVSKMLKYSARITALES